MLADVVVAFVVLLAPVNALSRSGAQWVNLQRLPPAPSGPTTLATAAASFPSFTFTQPLDHFSDTGFTWEQRFWVSDRHYQAGGPVIVLDSGESSGTGRLPYLDTGIVDILANATGGLGVVLEHRYYGTSVPVSNFTTDSLRLVHATSVEIASHVPAFQMAQHRPSAGGLGEFHGEREVCEYF